MSDHVEVHNYTSQDAQPTLAIFLEAVTKTAAPHYTPEQIGAWAAPRERDLVTWHQRRSSRATLVATVDDEAAGFSDVDIEGFIDMLFVAPRFGRRGIATRLLREVESRAREVGARSLSVDASVVARPLLERLGFSVEAEQQPELRGVRLVNYRMVKRLG